MAAISADYIPAVPRVNVHQAGGDGPVYCAAMTLKEVFEIAGAIIASLGGSSAIVFALSGYFGKRWADRALERQKQEYTKLNIEFSNQIDIATRRIQIELDALGHLHKLRTEAEFDKLQGLWSQITAVRGALYALPRAGFAFLPSDEKKRKEFHMDASSSFLEKYNTAQQFLNENALSIPKQIGDAANKLLAIAQQQVPQVLLLPDPFDPDPMMNFFGETSRQFFDKREKQVQEYGKEAEKLELTMREYLQGKQSAGKN